jgi:hypothetical protein
MTHKPTHKTTPRQQIERLVEKYYAQKNAMKASLTEADVSHQFLDPFFRALGWPVDDPARYKYELTTQAGRPDMTLIPEHGGTIFIEAKRFGALGELAQVQKTVSGTVKPGQMALPGMATDRTPEEQQVINYAFKNGGTWAILTNFEKLRLFNARRDWLVLSFEDPRAYLEDFDLLWQLSYESICQGGLDALSAQRYREDVDTDYLAFINHWRERLAQDIVQHPDANPWAFDEEGHVNLTDLRAVVQRVLDRLVVVRFAEDHLIIPVHTLYSFHELRQNNPYSFSLGEMVAHLYRRFDEEHNSALFALHLTDRAVFSDAVLGALIDKLYEARYRSMSADIMGNTYEQYLGQTLVQVGDVVETRDNVEMRKKQGSYYTPQVIVRYLVDRALGHYLKGKTADEVRELRVLDPSCGSGSFLIYAYQVLADFYRDEIARLETEAESRRQALAQQGLSPMEIRIELSTHLTEIERLRDYPSLILQHHLYGVDLDPQAAEIATVNLMMQAMADQATVDYAQNDRRLPLILNQNIKVGNSLIGAKPGDARLAAHADTLARLNHLRRELAADPDLPHVDALAAIDALCARVNRALDADLTAYFEDPTIHHPFNWAVEFPEVFVNEAGQPLGELDSVSGAGGFDVVIGNPPWEIIKPSTREFFANRVHIGEGEDLWRTYSRREADRVIVNLLEEDPALAEAWEEQQRLIAERTAYYREEAHYHHQGRADANTYKLFLERAYELMRAGGRLGYVIPSGIYTDLGTVDLRKLLLNHGRLQYLFSFANNRGIFPDVHASFRFVLLGFEKQGVTRTVQALFRVTVEDAVEVSAFDRVVKDPTNLLNMTVEQIKRLSPEHLVFPELKDGHDLEILNRLYADTPLLRESMSEVWDLQLANEFHMTNHRHLFNEEGRGWPVYEGRMVDQFDHRVAYWRSGHGRRAKWHYSSAPDRFSSDYPWRAQYYIAPDVARERQVQKYSERVWRIGICDVTAPTNRRTVIAAMLPMRCAAGNTLNTAVIASDQDNAKKTLYLLAVLNSFAFDYIVRFSVKLHLNQFILLANPVPRLTPGDIHFDAIVPRAARLTCTTADFADLWTHVMDEPWDPTKGARETAERQRLRDELDVLVARLYGVSREAFAHILGTFPLVFPDDEQGRAKKTALLDLMSEL